jgi:hypothetical protein
MRDEAGVIRTTPAVDVPGELRTLDSVLGWSALGCVERLIQYLPQDWFIRGCELANCVVHGIERGSDGDKGPPSLKIYTKAGYVRAIENRIQKRRGIDPILRSG